VTKNIETESELEREFSYLLKLQRRATVDYDRQTSQDRVAYEAKTRTASYTILIEIDQ
jgi:hypothetical protein